VSSATVRFDGAGSSVEVATGFGPRIVGLLVEERNLFAELPDDTLEGPEGLAYHLRGGHRLWAAPEVPAVTYQPDDEPCTLARVGDGIRVEGKPDGAGILKAMTITGIPDGWLVDHELTNRGRAPLRVAPWAISQFRLGGRVTLGFSGAGAGLQADRALVLWPYTDPTDARLTIGSDTLEVEASAGPPIKVGTGGSASGIRYELDGVRVDTHISVDRLASYADLGAAFQTYVCDRFCEIETLGPTAVLAPGASVTHREEWTIT
jgi:hypothetical protein